MNVLLMREEWINNLCNTYPDNILLRTSDEVLFVTIESDIFPYFKNIEPIFNLRIECVQETKTLRELEPDPESELVVQPKYEVIYLPQVPQEKIDLPICQMHQATEF